MLKLAFCSFVVLGISSAGFASVHPDHPLRALKLGAEVVFGEELKDQAWGWYQNGARLGRVSELDLTQPHCILQTIFKARTQDPSRTVVVTAIDGAFNDFILESGSGRFSTTLKLESTAGFSGYIRCDMRSYGQMAEVGIEEMQQIFGGALRWGYKEIESSDVDAASVLNQEIATGSLALTVQREFPGPNPQIRPQWWLQDGQIAASADQSRPHCSVIPMSSPRANPLTANRRFTTSHIAASYAKNSLSVPGALTVVLFLKGADAMEDVRLFCSSGTYARPTLEQLSLATGEWLSWSF